MNVPFVDLAAAYRAQQDAIDTAVARVLAGGRYILGPEVRAFEAEFAAFHGSPHAVGVASGTDALLLALKALDIGPGDEVITVSHTAVATAAAIERSGATPVFVDVHPHTFTLDPALLTAALTAYTKAIVPVHLYGQPAHMDPILAFARNHHLSVVEDNAQAHGATGNGRLAGTMGHLAAFSFYPTKNLGALGDGGAILCPDPALAERLRALRQYGWSKRYVSEEVGFNSRLDELQAAILRIKLQGLQEGNEARRAAAARYHELLAGCPIELPVERPSARHVFHLYVIQADERDELARFLTLEGVGSAVHYPIPVHRQPAYERYGYEPGTLPVTERLAERVLSLPMFPQITEAQQTAVAYALRAFYGL